MGIITEADGTPDRNDYSLGHHGFPTFETESFLPDDFDYDVVYESDAVEHQVQLLLKELYQDRIRQDIEFAKRVPWSVFRHYGVCLVPDQLYAAAERECYGAVQRCYQTNARCPGFLCGLQGPGVA